ncbi:hypothetical protein R6Q57_024750 [Mikania cordata]
MNLGVNPGPLNEDVLFLSDTHRARALFTNTIPDNVQLNIHSKHPCHLQHQNQEAHNLLAAHHH